MAKKVKGLWVDGGWARVGWFWFLLALNDTNRYQDDGDGTHFFLTFNRSTLMHSAAEHSFCFGWEMCLIDCV